MGTTKFKVSSLPFRLYIKQINQFFLSSVVSVLVCSGWVTKAVWMCVAVQVQLFSEPDFQGRLVALEDSAAALDEDFLPRSCKVLAGRYSRHS